MKLLPLCVLLLLVIPLTSATVVVGNSKEWHDLYLGTMYAGLNDHSFLFFDSLGDADIQTRTIPKDEPIIVLESTSRPVVPNYQNILNVGGYSSVEVMTYDGYTELQRMLFGDAKYPGWIILHPEFGAEAMAAASYMIKAGYAPAFLNAENVPEVEELAQGERLLVGHFPIRTIMGLEGDRITGFPMQNAQALTVRAQEEYPEEWALLSRTDSFDPGSLVSGRPLYLYNGELADLVQPIQESEISRFEVIGPDLADLAKSVEAQVGRDLHLLLKYGQTITNVPGLEGKILGIRQVPVPAPQVGIVFEEAVYYESLKTLALTYTNIGTLPALFVTSVEYGDVVISDEKLHTIGAGETLTIPYRMNITEMTPTATVNTRYGLERPLTRTVAQAGSAVLRANVTRIDRADTTDVEVGKVAYDGERGRLLVTLRSNGPALVDIELFVDEETTLSGEAREIDGERTISIDTPYLAPDALVGNTYDLHVFYGSDTTANVKQVEVLVEQASSFNLFPYVIAGIVTFILVLAAVLITRKRG